MTAEERAKRQAFVDELNALCTKHGLFITLGCGCCGGSAVAEKRPTQSAVYSLGTSGGYLEEA